jgi:hypothetical protein
MVWKCRTYGAQCNYEYINQIQTRSGGLEGGGGWRMRRRRRRRERMNEKIKRQKEDIQRINREEREMQAKWEQIRNRMCVQVR